MPCAPVRTIEDVAQDEHLNDRGYFVDVEHPVAGHSSIRGHLSGCRRRRDG